MDGGANAAQARIREAEWLSRASGNGADTAAGTQRAGQAPDYAEVLAHERQLDRIRQLATDRGYKFADLTHGLALMASIGIAFGETEYVLLGIMMGAPEKLYITSGVLRNIRQDRLAALEACNARTRGNPGFPCFFGDGPEWDIVLQQAHLVELMFRAPAYFDLCVEEVPNAVNSFREVLAEADLGGSPFHWREDDLERLVQRST
jgi:hypothetical protein